MSAFHHEGSNKYYGDIAFAAKDLLLKLLAEKAQEAGESIPSCVRPASKRADNERTILEELSFATPVHITTIVKVLGIEPKLFQFPILVPYH